MARLKTGPKVVIAAVIGFGAFFALRTASQHGLVPSFGWAKPKVIETATDIATAKDVGVGSTAALGLPSTEPADVGGPELRGEYWAWNAHMGVLYAVGGPRTTKGSLFEQAGLRATSARQDDTEQMKADLVAYCKAYAGGDRTPQVGANAVTIMGSQAAGFFEDVNARLAKECNSKAVIVYVAGRSDGEDAVMGPADWKGNPAAAKGKAVSVVPLEGDADLLKKWVRDNGLKFNPDPGTYDAEAVNIVAAKDFVDAADKYVSGYCDPDRAVIKGGRKTTETTRVCIDAVSTWTPADVKVAMGKGGLVRIVSTHEYSGLMPNVFIVLDNWAQANRVSLVKAITAFGQAGSQLLGRPEALRRGCEISAQVYDQETADFWCKYYKGTTERDRTGQPVQLGGSRVATLADNEVWFGLKPGYENVYARVYTTFGNMLIELYPEQLKQFPKADDVVDVSYLKEALKTAPTGEAEHTTFAAGASGSKIAKRSWHIIFKTGSADLTPEAQTTMEELLNDLLTAGGGLAVEVQGHTDSQGNAEANQALSEARAFAVKQWLERKAPGNFGEGRITPRAFGQTQPVASNATAEGRAQNRRVDIILREAQ